jgi:hypothetical protein
MRGYCHRCSLKLAAGALGMESEGGSLIQTEERRRGR